ncbi:MAG: DUF3553 domain-containing protein [Pseudomonadota bacterium]
MLLLLEPGMIVRNPALPDWGLGQVQSVTGDRATINFEHIGKVLIRPSDVTLEIVSQDEF